MTDLTKVKLFLFAFISGVFALAVYMNSGPVENYLLRSYPGSGSSVLSIPGAVPGF